MTQDMILSLAKRLNKKEVTLKDLKNLGYNEQTLDDVCIKRFFKEEELTRIKTWDDYHKALAIVGRIYNEQEDKSKHAAAGHFLRVSECVETLEEKAAALLHDVIEDGYLTTGALRNLGFSENIIEALEILNHDKEKYASYKEYIDAIIASRNLIALRIKFWDMQDNQSPLRVNDLNPKQKEKATNKYKEYIPKVVIAIKEIEEEQYLIRKRRFI